jgi:hypothetical protein
VGEGGLTAEPLGVVASGDQQLPGVLDADRQQPQGSWCCLGDELAQPLVGHLDLLLQGQDARRHRPQRCLGRLGRVGQLGKVGSQPGAGHHLSCGRPPVQRLADHGRGGEDHGLGAG